MIIEYIILKLEIPNVFAAIMNSFGTLEKDEKRTLDVNGSAAIICALKIYMETKSEKKENCPWVCIKAKLIVIAEVAMGIKIIGEVSLSILFVLNCKEE